MNKNCLNSPFSPVVVIMGLLCQISRTHPYKTPVINSVILVLPSNPSIPCLIPPCHQIQKNLETFEFDILSRLTTFESLSFSKYSKNFSKINGILKQQLNTNFEVLQNDRFNSSLSRFARSFAGFCRGEYGKFLTEAPLLPLQTL